MNTLLRHWDLMRETLAPLVARWPLWWPAAVCVGLVLMMVTVAIFGESRHTDTGRRVRRMAKRGTRPSRISRRTGLAQDMVRDLAVVGGSPDAPEFGDELWAQLTARR